MRMNSLKILTARFRKTPPFAAAAVLLAGCATFSSLPPEAKATTRIAVSSARVDVGKPKLTFSEGVYSVQGFVQRNLSRVSTAGSYLEVALFNAAGEKLRVERVSFTPAELPLRGGRHGRYGTYQLTLGALPPGTARLEVRAHDVTMPSDSRQNPTSITRP